VANIHIFSIDRTVEGSLAVTFVTNARMVMLETPNSETVQDLHLNADVILRAQFDPTVPMGGTVFAK
jgi:hypothetical protein